MSLVMGSTQCLQLLSSSPTLLPFQGMWQR